VSNHESSSEDPRVQIIEPRKAIITDTILNSDKLARRQTRSTTKLSNLETAQRLLLLEKSVEFVVVRAKSPV